MSTPLTDADGGRQFAALVHDEGILRVMLGCALFIAFF